MSSKAIIIALFGAALVTQACTPESKTTLEPVEKPEVKSEVTQSPVKPTNELTTNSPGQPPKTLPLAKPVGATNAPLVNSNRRMSSQTKQYKMPKGEKTFMDVIAAQEKCSIFLELLKLSGEAEKLESGSFTVFTPNDEAFKKLPAGFVSQLKSNPETLKSFVELHIAKIALTTEMLGKGTGYRAINGLQVNIERSNGEIRLNGSKILKGDLGAKKGVVFIVESVIQ